MEPVYIKESFNTPKIILDKKKGIFSFEGKSIPEDTTDFYGRIDKWFEEYKKNPNPRTIVHFKFDYYNTSTSQSILEILNILKEIKEKGFEINVYWYYDKSDSDLLESGEEYANIVPIPFEFIENES